MASESGSPAAAATTAEYTNALSFVSLTLTPRVPATGSLRFRSRSARPARLFA